MPTITRAHSRICFFISTPSQCKFHKTKGGLFFHDNIWHGARPLITSARTHLCDDEHFIQSSIPILKAVFWEPPPSYGISLAFFFNPPPPLLLPSASFALKLLLLELLSCPNRYNLHRLSVLGWDAPSLLIPPLRLWDKGAIPQCTPVTCDAGLGVEISPGSRTASSTPKI